VRPSAFLAVLALVAAGFTGAVIVTADAHPHEQAAHETGPPEHARGPVDDRARGVTHTGLEAGTPRCSAGYAFESPGLTDLCTHGPDPAPHWVADVRTADTDPVGPEVADVATAGPACDGDGISGNRVQALYVRPSDQPDRFNDYLESIRAWAVAVQQHYRNSAAATGGDLAMRFVHAPAAADGTCVIDVKHVVIGASDDNTFDATINAVRAQGFNAGTRNYAMWVEANTYCGIGTLYNDDRASTSNYNNQDIASYSRVDRGCWSWSAAMTHELSHNVGAVQNSAPHTTGGFHCNDNNDIMCYSDGGPSSSLYTDPSCADGSYANLLDCNHDDYFHTNPPQGNYLASHWNTANSRWLFTPTTPEPGDTTPPTLTVTSPASGSWVGGWAQPVAGTVADNGGLDNVDRVEVTIGSVSDTVYTNGDDAWDTAFDLTGLADGPATLTAVAFDKAGNASAPLSVGVTIDATAPQLVLMAPAPEAALAGTVDVVVDANDVGAGVTGVTVELEGDQVVEVPANFDGTSWVASVPTTGLADGPAWLWTHGLDGVGLLGSDEGFAVTIDNVADDTTPPELAVTSPDSGAMVTSDDLVVTGTLQDDVAIGQVRVGWPGAAPVTTTPAGDGTWSVDFPVTVPNGSATIEVSGFDAAGNATSASVPVVVDRDLAPPAVTIATPTADEVVGGQVTVSGTVSDDRGVGSLDVVFGGVVRPALVNGDGTWTTTIDTTTVGDGPAWVDAYAWDTAGKQGAASVRVEVDNVAEPITDTFSGALNKRQPATSFGFATLAGEVVLTVDDGSTSTASAKPDGKGGGNGKGGRTPPTWVVEVYDGNGALIATTSGTSPVTLTLSLAAGDYTAVVSNGKGGFTLTVAHW